MQRNRILILGLVIILIVSGLALLYENTSSSFKEFADRLYKHEKIAIVFDTSFSPSQETRVKIMQCAVNFIGGGFFAKSNKNLSLFGCDEKGCYESNSNATLLSKDKVFALIGPNPYIHIKYRKEQGSAVYVNYLEVFINESSDPSQCQLVLHYT